MKEMFQTAQRFSIRKYSLGAVSVLLGAVFLAQGPVVSADQVTDSAAASVTLTQVEEKPQETLEATALPAEPASLVESLPVAEESQLEPAESQTGSTQALPSETAPAPASDEVALAESPSVATKVEATLETPAETPQVQAEEVPAEPVVVKKTKGYAAANVARSATSISTDTSRRRAPKKAKTTGLQVEKTTNRQGTGSGLADLETEAVSTKPNAERSASQGTTSFYSSRSASAARGDDYPARFKYSSTGIDDWRLYVRQCTSFAAYRLSSANGFELPAAYGNGGQWGYRAQREGYRVDKNPAIGSIAWWDDGGYGHVAWVSNVQGSTVEIEEYNFNWSESYNKRNVSISSVSGFIHFKDLGTSLQNTSQQASNTTNSSAIAESGTYTFSKRSSIRAAASLSSPELAYYEAGQTVNYDSKLKADGQEWISYLSFAGNRRYIAVAELAKPVDTTKPTTGTISIQNHNPEKGSFDIIVSNVYHAKGIQAVVIPTWSDADGQDDLKWYEATRQADGSYKQTVTISDHKNVTGLYHAHLYYRQHDGTMVGAGGTKTEVAPAQKTSGNITIQNNNTTTGTFDIIISNVYNSKGIKAVVLPTWSDADGQDDIKWYEATRQSDGTYKQTVKASDHKNSTGLYHAHLYYRQDDGSLVGAGGTTTTVSIQPQRQQPSIPSSGNYSFSARASVRATSSLSSPELAYYTAGQSVNYDRVLQAEGRTWISYIAGSGNRRYIAIN